MMILNSELSLLITYLDVISIFLQFKRKENKVKNLSSNMNNLNSEQKKNKCLLYILLLLATVNYAISDNFAIVIHYTVKSDF